MIENTNNQKKVGIFTRNKVCLIISFLIMTFLLVFITTVLMVYMIYRKSNSRSEDNDESTYLGYSEITPSLNETSPGIVRIYKAILGNNEYITYKNEINGNLVIISKFRNTKYECTGSCYCETEEHISSRRNSPQVVLNRGLFVILTAFSASIAVNIARTSFTNSCLEKYSSVCQESNIMSEVNSCKEKGCSGGCELDEFDEDEIIRYDFKCSGHCVRNPRIKEMNTIMKAHEQVGNCGDLSLANEVEITAKKSMDMNSVNKLAKRKFLETSLTPFCYHNSQFKYNMIEACDDRGSKIVPKWLKNACVGSNKSGDNLFCTLISEK